MPSSDTQTLDRRRNDTRQRLVVSALELFARQGYASTSVAEIESAVGLRAGGGGLYRHFSSKEELLLAVIEEYHTRVRELRHRLASSRPDDPDPLDFAGELRGLLDALARFLSGEQPVVQLSTDTATLPEAVRHALGSAWDEGYGMAEDLLRRYRTMPDDVSALAIMVIGSLNHYAAHLGMWHEEPNGVPLGRYLDAWVGLWERVLTGSARREVSSGPDEQ